MQEYKVNKYTLLFDFDGVIMDTEGQYSKFWDAVGQKYLNLENFGMKIKGQSMKRIRFMYFSDCPEIGDKIVDDIMSYEEKLSYYYINGAEEFIKEASQKNVNIAVVTSSNDMKMNNVYAAHPELKDYFHYFITANQITKSKPNPECFLLGMKMFNAIPSRTIIFEDSIYGLTAARKSGAFVVGLATTYTKEEIEPLSDLVINDFTNTSVEEIISIAKKRS